MILPRLLHLPLPVLRLVLVRDSLETWRTSSRGSTLNMSTLKRSLTKQLTNRRCRETRRRRSDVRCFQWLSPCCPYLLSSSSPWPNQSGLPRFHLTTTRVCVRWRMLYLYKELLSVTQFGLQKTPGCIAWYRVTMELTKMLWIKILYSTQTDVPLTWLVTKEKTRGRIKLTAFVNRYFEGV